MQQPLRIREAQLRVLRDAAHLAAMEAALLLHFPDQCAAKTPAELESFILASGARARSFGLTMPELQGFASFELLFGDRYWETKDYRWARRILENKDIEQPAERFRQLREAAIFFVAAAEEKAEREEEQARAQFEMMEEHPA